MTFGWKLNILLFSIIQLTKVLSLKRYEPNVRQNESVLMTLLEEMVLFLVRGFAIS